MTSEENDINYQREDFPKRYLDALKLCDIDVNDAFEPDGFNLGRLYMPRVMRFLHGVFASGKHRGDAVMDMCSGPSIHSMLTPSKYYSSIYMAEFSAANRRAVEAWWEDKSLPFDWTPYMELVGKLEGVPPEVVAERTRNKIRGTYRCDLTAAKPLANFTPPLVDCLVSSLTLETAATTEEQYKEIMKKVSSFIKPGGLFVLMGVLNATWYMVDGQKYYDVCLDKPFVEEAISEAGLVIESYEDHVVPPSEVNNPGQVYFFLTAKKS